MFTDNADPVKLLALDMKTGKIVASLPVLDDLPEGYQMAVENSAIVYDDSEGTVSTIVCNWFGAGNAGLADPNNDSSMNNLSGSAADLELYAYGADGKLAEVSKELWTITDEAGTGVDTLADGTLYELRVSIADGGALDLSEEEKKIIISVVLAK